MIKTIFVPLRVRTLTLTLIQILTQTLTNTNPNPNRTPTPKATFVLPGAASPAGAAPVSDMDQAATYLDRYRLGLASSQTCLELTLVLAVLVQAAATTDTPFHRSHQVQFNATTEDSTAATAAAVPLVHVASPVPVREGMPRDVLERAADAFLWVDTDRSGTISKQEYDAASPQLDYDAFGIMDSDGTGQVRVRVRVRVTVRVRVRVRIVGTVRHSTSLASYTPSTTPDSDA